MNPPNEKELSYPSRAGESEPCVGRGNIDKVVVTTPGELEVAALVWARSVLVTEDALELVKDKAT